jgi:hypothetical protein
MKTMSIASLKRIGSLLLMCILSGQTVIRAQVNSWPVLEEVRQVFDHKIQDGPTLTFNRDQLRNGDHSILLYQENMYQNLKDLSSDQLTIELPIESSNYIILLRRVDLGAFRHTENAKTTLSDLHIPICYRGIVKDMNQLHNVAMTIYENGLILTLYFPTKTWSIAPQQVSGPRTQFAREYEITAKEEFTINSEINFCGMTDTNQINDIVPTSHSRAPQDKCLYVFVECFDSLYRWQNSSYQKTINYVYELFNHVALGYANEQINIKISEINIWTTTDPYGQANSAQALADLSAFYQDNYWGNLCVGLDFSAGSTNASRGGLAGAFGRIKSEYPNACPSYTVPQHSFCYNDLNYNWVNVQNFPSGPVTTQGQVYLVMHEMGHMLGSRHTQWCGWDLGGGNFGALDNCFATEGGCPMGPAPGAAGGTIMSYCVYTGQFVNFNNGFGPLPGGVIRSFVDNNACLSNCPTCIPDATINFSSIYLPNTVYRYEVSNTITATGLLISTEYAVMDAGVRITISPGFTASAGSNVHMVINGCGGIQ